MQKAKNKKARKPAKKVTAKVPAVIEESPAEEAPIAEVVEEASTDVVAESPKPAAYTVVAVGFPWRGSMQYPGAVIDASDATDEERSALDTGVSAGRLSV